MQLKINSTSIFLDYLIRILRYGKRRHKRDIHILKTNTLAEFKFRMLVSTHREVFDYGDVVVASPVEFLCLFSDVGVYEHGVSFRVEILLPPHDVWAVGVGHTPVEAGLAVALGV